MSIGELRRLRVVRVPETLDEQIASEVDPRWPQFDVLDPPGWLVDTIQGRGVATESFNQLKTKIMKEGFVYSPLVKAFVRKQ